jgi:hypothetical protein
MAPTALAAPQPVTRRSTSSPFFGPISGPVLTVLLVTGLYLPTLWTRFDFIDDGNLVYPAAPMPAAERVQLVWDKIEANYRDLGPFRPVLWVHWETQAELLGADPFAWRFARWLWTGFAASVLLWLLRELGIRPLAASVTTALAMWNPFRGEVWTSLTLAEGVAMPYALLGLVCAVRGARSRRPWPWDIGAMLFVLAALGCKNTFAALVPAQVFLRLAPDGRQLRQAWRQRGWRACLLALTLLMPVVHFIVFKLNRRPGNYDPGLFSGEQAVLLLHLLRGTLSLDFLAPGLVLAAVALAAAGRLRQVWNDYRGACLAAVLLLVFGYGIYLPMQGVAGRYSMPAVWGGDLLIAALLSTLAVAPISLWKRLAIGALTGGLIVLAVANVGRQQKFAARADMLWHALEYVEREAPQGGCIEWVSGKELDAEEGIHFQWHLQARGRQDLQVRLVDGAGNVQQRVELSSEGPAPAMRVDGRRPGPDQAGAVLQTFTEPYHLGRKHFTCFLLRGPAGPGSP